MDDYELAKKGSRAAYFLAMAGITLYFVVAFFQELKSAKDYSYPVTSYRYFEEKSLFADSEKVEVIYETDSEIEKKTYYVSSIEIGKKTEVVVHKGDNFINSSTLYMTQEDYESLFSEGDKE